jgi:hypothetical protein
MEIFKEELLKKIVSWLRKSLLTNLSIMTANQSKNRIVSWKRPKYKQKRGSRQSPLPCLRFIKETLRCIDKGMWYYQSRE